MRSIWLAFLAGLLFWSAAFAEDHPSYQALWDSVVQAPDCTRKDFLDFTLFTCDKQEAVWYFTKPNHPAHPGVIKRSVVQDANGVSVHDQGWSFATDAAQPAFKTFLAQISAMDEEAREAMAAQHGAPSPAQSVHIEGNWQPQEGDDQAVVALSTRYFSLEDAQKYDDAYALFDPGLAAQTSFAQYQNLAGKAIKDVGHVKVRTLKTIDWEKDQPGGPNGIFAALDYTAETESGQLCGFVAWKQQPDGFYTLVR
jgi:Protein of unknown function (DUF4019)